MRTVSGPCNQVSTSPGASRVDARAVHAGTAVDPRQLRMDPGTDQAEDVGEHGATELGDQHPPGDHRDPAAGYVAAQVGATGGGRHQRLERGRMAGLEQRDPPSECKPLGAGQRCEQRRAGAGDRVARGRAAQRGHDEHGCDCDDCGYRGNAGEPRVATAAGTVIERGEDCIRQVRCGRKIAAGARRELRAGARERQHPLREGHDRGLAPQRLPSLHERLHRDSLRLRRRSDA